MSYSYDKSYIIATQKKWEDKVMIERLFQTIEQMIDERVPIAVYKYINEHKDKLLIDVETSINGKSIESDKIIEDLQNMLVEHMKFQ